MTKPLALVLTLAALAGPVLAQAPDVFENGVVNGASFTPFGRPGHPTAPGSIVSIFGTNLASGLAQASSIPLSTSLGGTSVTFNGTPAPLFVVTAGQINAQLPAGLTGSTATIVVQRAGAGSSTPRTIQIAPTSPAIFTDPPGGAGQGIVVYALDPTVFAAVPSLRLPNARPAKAGDFLTIYTNALGAVNPAVPDGNAAPSSPPLAATTTTPVVTLGGVRCDVLFSGLVPGLVGLYQINIQVPQGVRTGSAVPLQIAMGGVTSSDQVTIAVQ
ncbi:MAG: hypothetical protein HY238_26155 [Acidobacteria bacterium]|nr:hypothetical protein [Acidobacteriota bacterium]